MVTNPRKKTSTRRIRPLNQPIPIKIIEDGNGKPKKVGMPRYTTRINSIQDTWEIIDEWWCPNPIERRYYKVVLEEDVVITIFKDLISTRWYEQNYAETNDFLR